MQYIDPKNSLVVDEALVDDVADIDDAIAGMRSERGIAGELPRIQEPGSSSYEGILPDSRHFVLVRRTHWREGQYIVQLRYQPLADLSVVHPDQVERAVVSTSEEAREQLAEWCTERGLAPEDIQISDDASSSVPRSSAQPGRPNAPSLSWSSCW